MMMPRKLALDLHQPHLLTIQIGSDLGSQCSEKLVNFAGMLPWFIMGASRV